MQQRQRPMPACLNSPMHLRQDGYHRAVCLAKAGQVEAGAQALQAAFKDGLRYRLPNVHEKDTSLNVFHARPYWPTIDRLADSTHAQYAAKRDSGLIQIVIDLRDSLFTVAVPLQALARDTANHPQKRAKYDSLAAQVEARTVYVERRLDSLYRLGKPPHIDVAGAKGYIAYKDMLFFMPTPWLMRKLPTLWQAVRKGNFLPNHYAVLEDVVAKRMNVPQRFCTQIIPHPSRQGAVVYHTVSQPAHIDAYRSVVGLPSLQAQTARMVLNRGMKVWYSENDQNTFSYD